MKARQLSGGQRRRVDVAMGLVGSPKLLFLDEPSAGLGPEARQGLGRLVRSLRDEYGVSVVVSSHYLEEIESIADKAVVINEGSVVAQGSPAQLTKRFGKDQMDFCVPRHDSPAALSVLKKAFPEATVKEKGSPPDEPSALLELRTDGGERVIPAAVLLLRDAVVDLVSLSVRKYGLGEAFLEITGKELQ